MSQLTNIQLLTNQTDKDALFMVLIDLARQEFLDYTGRADVPAAAEGLITSMVVEKFNRIGAEGIDTQRYSSIDETFVDGYSANINLQLKRYRKVKLL